MAIIINATYQKRLGLPGYSSHSFSASVETELTDLDQVSGELSDLYGLLQEAVDREIQHVGFLPDHDYGTDADPTVHSNGATPANGNGGENGNGAHPKDAWQCSDKQRQLIADLTAELNLDEAALDQRARRLFRLPARQLNKLAASGLISDLLAEAGARRQGNGQADNGNGTRRRQPATAAPRRGGAS